ncbi:Uncharacterised protein [Kluyvera cryocrescens]|nr:Uncharacterised protein [Kluyvera cryocrescens]
MVRLIEEAVGFRPWFWETEKGERMGMSERKNRNDDTAFDLSP